MDFDVFLRLSNIWPSAHDADTNPKGGTGHGTRGWARDPCEGGPIDEDAREVGDALGSGVAKDTITWEMAEGLATTIRGLMWTGT